ncbi:hypothetical protein QFZ99_005069 [Paraburkholderia atlantica]|uniref:Uncharacterized protein n=1 Tax=Paraburkholderia atlantica TaxID=2654982 RepID=A0A7W8Q4N0_PARAM|nr:hypothetical protein [Paraburkholderia atlantica]
MPPPGHFMQFSRPTPKVIPLAATERPWGRSIIYIDFHQHLMRLI